MTACLLRARKKKKEENEEEEKKEEEDGTEEGKDVDDEVGLEEELYLSMARSQDTTSS